MLKTLALRTATRRLVGYNDGVSVLYVAFDFEQPR